MAKTEVIRKAPPPQPPPQIEKIILELTEKEARALRTVLCRVGGSPTSTPRGEIDNIRESLTEAGVTPYRTVDSTSTSIYDSDIHAATEGGGLYFRTWSQIANK